MGIIYVDIFIAKNINIAQWYFEDYRFFYVFAFYNIIYSLGLHKTDDMNKTNTIQSLES